MTGNWGGPRIGKRCSKATWECAVVLATPKDPTQSGCGVLLWFCTVAIRNGNLKVIVQIGVRSLPRSANTLFAHVCIVASDLVIKLIIQHSMKVDAIEPTTLFETRAKIAHDIFPIRQSSNLGKFDVPYLANWASPSAVPCADTPSLALAPSKNLKTRA